MAPKAAYLTTALIATDMRRSIDFYSLLGLELIDYEGEPQDPHWARMHGEGGDLMLMTPDPDDPAPKAPRERFFLYLYTDELPALREHLIANGIKVSDIHHPPYMKDGEITVTAPDGFYVFVGQWDAARHQQWEQERNERMKKLGAPKRP